MGHWKRQKITEKWSYGITFTGTFVNEKTINYITKYMMKVDIENKNFRGKVLCSAGIGKGYTERYDAKRHKYKKNETIEYCTWTNSVIDSVKHMLGATRINVSSTDISSDSE